MPSAREPKRSSLVDENRYADDSPPPPRDRTVRPKFSGRARRPAATPARVPATPHTYAPTPTSIRTVEPRDDF